MGISSVRRLALLGTLGVLAGSAWLFVWHSKAQAQTVVRLGALFPATNFDSVA